MIYLADAFTSRGFAFADVKCRRRITANDLSSADGRRVAEYISRSLEAGMQMDERLFGPGYIAAMRDISGAIDFLVEHGPSLRLTCSGFGLLGVGAGGVAGLGLAFPPQDLEDRFRAPDVIATFGAALAQPWRISDAAPPCLVFHATNDDLMPMRDVEFMKKRAKRKNAPVEFAQGNAAHLASEIERAMDHFSMLLDVGNELKEAG
ncbi:hypothetical protein [Litoreibacter roseus]|uniref:hypothetical protein n=1 Tax=Litoreibacter roseus TaxID=2601869 RepID=UPI00135AFA12|nr:hypothetical protein [Litoreibacter roseus]